MRIQSDGQCPFSELLVALGGEGYDYLENHTPDGPKGPTEIWNRLNNSVMYSEGG